MIDFLPKHSDMALSQVVVFFDSSTVPQGIMMRSASFCCLVAISIVPAMSVVVHMYGWLAKDSITTGWTLSAPCLYMVGNGRHVRTNEPIQKQQNSFLSTGFAPLFMTGFYIWVWKIIKLYTIYNITTDPLHSGSPDPQNSWKVEKVSL